MFKDIRFPLYRVFISISIGLFVLIFFSELLKTAFNQLFDQNVQFKNLSIDKWFICVPIALIIGEFFCILGDWLIGFLLFDYSIFRENRRIKRVAPLSDRWLYFF